MKKRMEFWTEDRDVAGRNETYEICGGGPAEVEANRRPQGDGWKFVRYYDNPRAGTTLVGRWERVVAHAEKGAGTG